MTSCDTFRDDLPAYALGQCDAAASDAVAEHVRTCSARRSELAELQAAWSALPRALPSAAPPADLFQRVIDRIDGPRTLADSRTASSRVDAARPAGKATRRERILSYVLAASVLVGLTFAYLQFTQPEDAVAQRSAESLAKRLGNLRQLERLMRSDSVRLVSFKRAESADVEAYLLVDAAAQQWHFFAKLPPAAGGKTYQVWAADNGGRLLPGPTFDVNEDGFGRALVDLPELKLEAATKVVVTQEPRGGSPQPTGKPVLEASL